MTGAQSRTPGLDVDRRIAKRPFLAAVTCLSQGWYLHHAGREALPPALQWRFYVGAEVGRRARTELGAGRLLPGPPSAGTAQALEATSQALADPAARLLFEASFAHQSFIARADALRRNGDRWDVIEVKQGMAPADGERPKTDYIQDLAFTVFVAQAAGLPLGRCILMLIRKNYRLGDAGGLLQEVDVTEFVVPMTAEFRSLAPAVASALAAGDGPEPSLRFACRDCAYFESACVGVGVPDPIFDLPRLSPKRFEELKQFARLSALPADTVLTSLQQRVLDVYRACSNPGAGAGTGAPWVDRAGLAPLAAVEWPAYYLDFESVSPALPWFEGSAPYDQVPFQYSIHVCDAPGHAVAHHEYLAPCDRDWRRELAERLLECLGERGSVIAYSAHERRMLGYLAAMFADLAPRIAGVMQRLFDLEAIVRNGYCEAGFRGRTSIKYVLPAMVPELSYDGLAVSGGEDAAGVFALMRVGDYGFVPLNHARHREELLAYCRLDTLGMVRVHERLWRVRQEGA